jgi:hypothetical protein
VTVIKLSNGTTGYKGECTILSIISTPLVVAFCTLILHWNIFFQYYVLLKDSICTALRGAVLHCFLMDFRHRATLCCTALLTVHSLLTLHSTSLYLILRYSLPQGIRDDRVVPVCETSPDRQGVAFQPRPGLPLL